KQSGVKLPDTRKTSFNVSMNLEECEKVCLRNCNCIAYANLDIRSGGSGCLIWLDDLIDMMTYAEDGEDINVRMATSELRVPNHTFVLKVGVAIMLLRNIDQAID
nr:G-type lectin S-receptor-like serine/threonine-protein kinase At4g27290 [Tanacetum cinerariifolium]